MYLVPTGRALKSECRWKQGGPLSTIRHWYVYHDERLRFRENEPRPVDHTHTRACTGSCRCNLMCARRSFCVSDARCLAVQYAPSRNVLTAAPCVPRRTLLTEALLYFIWLSEAKSKPPAREGSISRTPPISTQEIFHMRRGHLTFCIAS